MKENNAAQAAEPQTVLSFDERERILCQFIGEPINHDRGMAIAIESAVLSKLRAPVADERAAFEAEYVDHCGMRLEDYEFDYDPATNRYRDDCEQSAWWGWHTGRAALASAPVACNCPGGNKPADLHAPNCPVRVSSARLLDPYDGGTWVASAPVAGEAQPVATLHDDGYYTWHGAKPEGYGWAGWRMPVYAAPQASAEDVRNAALEEAAHLMEQTGKRIAASDIRALKQPQADKDARPCSCPSGDGSLRHPCAVHPADRQQRAGDVDDREAWAADMIAAGAQHLGDECWEWESDDFLFHLWQVATDRQSAGDVDVGRLLTAAKGMTKLYGNVWDRTDGALVVFPENVARFDAAFDALRAAVGEVVDDAAQPGQGERDA